MQGQMHFIPMEEFIPKKRKRSSSPQDPSVGILTRSKSQIYLHCNRSGRAWSDSFRRSKYHAELRFEPAGFSSKTSVQRGNQKCRQKSVTAETSDSTQMDDWSTNLIKDLRSRRVFSLGSMADDGEVEKESERRKGATEDRLSSDSIKIDCTSSGSLFDKEDTIAKCLDGRKVEESKSDVEFSSQERKSTNLQVAEGNARNSVEDEISEEECVQATPPDAEILQKLSISSDGLQDNIHKKDSDNSESRSVLSSRSRVKVFKVPYSFSYRRLLPYLTGMVQDKSCAAAKGNCSNVDNQLTTAGEFKVDSKSMEALASVSGSLDIHNFADELSAQHNADSSILIPKQRDSSAIVSSQTYLCSKHFVDSLNENIEIGVSSKDKNLESSNPDCAQKLHNPHINCDLNESKPLDGEDSAEKHQLCEDDEVRQGSCSMMQTESVGIEAFDLRCNDKTTDENRACSSLSSEEGNSTKEKGDNNGVDKIDCSNEESVLMTPPDVDVLVRPVVHKTADKGIEFASQSADQVLGRPVNGIVPTKNSCSNDNIMNSSSKRKLGLSPCSQLKLFKTRSSFSYRRLLPFLMDIAKDNSGDSRNGHSPKLKKSVEENLLSPLSMSVVDETPAQKLNCRSIHLEKNNDSCIIQMAKQASNHESGCMQSSLAASDHKTEYEQEQGSQIKGQNLAHGSSPDMAISSVVSPYSCAVDMVDPVLHESSTNNEDDNKTSKIMVINAANPVEAGSSSLSQNSYKLEASGPLEIAINGSKKGILKRNPRGCRGPCTCLNCASFRLNAERAFEFSRNQMLDAEEVAIELIKELSHVRYMFGKAASARGDDVVIHINQVKEACMRASEAEELAKSRLTQMNYDLNIHCRTTDGQRPRVKFANNVKKE